MNSDQATIEVSYTCHSCGLKDRPVRLRERRNDEDVVIYVRDVIGAVVGLDHKLASPSCRAQKMDQLKIPMAGVEYVGQAPRQ